MFGRPASWDPRTDSIVRQEAARLRKRLARHYDSEGASSDIRIELPVGGYVPAFRKAACASGTLGSGPVAAAASPRRTWWLPVWLGAGMVALTAAGLIWFLSKKPVSSHRQAKREAQELYLQGVRQWQKRTPASLNQAVDSFTQSIVRDPGYGRRTSDWRTVTTCCGNSRQCRRKKRFRGPWPPPKRPWRWMKTPLKRMHPWLLSRTGGTGTRH